MINFSMSESDFASFLSIKRGLQTTTVATYMSQVRRFIHFLDEREPSQHIVEQYLYELRERKHNNHSINTSLAAIISFQKYLQDRGFTKENFTDGFTTLKVEKKIVDVLTIKEIKKILSTHIRTKTGKIVISDKNYLFFTKILAYTGARFSEVAKLRVNKIYEDYILITETKGYEARKIYINPNLSKELQEWIKHKSPDDLVFETLGGKSMHPGDVLVNLRKRCEIAGIKKKVYPHLFRHSYATQLAIDGAQAEEIKKILGHKDIQTSLGYIHTADDTLKKATFRHALNREYLSPQDILKEFVRFVFSFKIQDDRRFSIVETKSETRFILDICIKKE